VLDLPLVRELTARATHVIHMAAIAGVDKVLESPVRTMRVNLIGTYNVLEAAHEAGTIERLVDFSTSEVFGTHAYKVEETHVTSQGSVGEARWTYAVSKLAGEYFAHSYFDEFALPACSVRPFNIYGPGQIGSGAIHHFTVRALAGDEIVIHGDGSQIRAWCYVDDIVHALLAVLEREEAVGQVFNVGNPRSVVTVFDLAARIKRLAGSDSEIVFKPLHYTDVEMRIPNVDKARKQLGWEPQVDLDDGLERTIAWYRERQPVQSLASQA
jgi:nucleoside-diphosphate-sugar epimerase